MQYNMVVSFVSGSGHYVNVLETDAGPSYYASLVTPFMDTTNKCAILFYKFHGSSEGSVSVISSKEDLTETVLREVRTTLC